MVPSPPATPRLNSLPASPDDPLWGRSPEAIALLGHLRSVLASKNAAIQSLSAVPVHTARVMEYFGFQRRHFRKAKFSLKYVLGWPGFSLEDGDVMRGPPLRPALAFTFPGRAPCPQARAGCSPTLFSSPSFTRNQLGDCNYCKARGGACPARTWSFVKSPSSLEEKEALDEAVAYERWMEEWAVHAQPIVMRKRKRVGEADPGGKGAKWAKRTGERVSEHSKDTPAPLDELGRNDNPLERATHTPSSPNRSTTSKRPASLNVCETRSAESTAQGSGTPATPATASSNLLGTYPSTSSASLAFSPSGLSATSPLLPPPSDQITAAHHLLLADSKQRAGLHPLPDLSALATAHQDAQDAQSAEQLCQVELTVLRASQAARDERIASLESLTGELELWARVAEQWAEEAEKRAAVLEERVEQELERGSVAEAEVARMRVVLERQRENGENGKDGLMLVRKRLAETQARLVKEQQVRKRLEVEVGRMKALADRYIA